LRDVRLDGSTLTIADVLNVAREMAHVDLEKTALSRTISNRKILEQILDKNPVLYGINTGFGALSNQRIPKEDLAQLQVNLLRSHATSVGNPLPKAVVRAMILLRANALIKGYSGVRPETVQLLVALLNKHVHPRIPETGSVGASGDLSPLSHMALVLIGEGEAEYNGAVLPGKIALEKTGLHPIELAAKEGLALNNGTQQMTAIGCLALHDAYSLLMSGEAALALSLEGLDGWIDAFDERIHKLRPHPGQISVAQTVRRLLKGSRMVRTVKNGVLDGVRPQDPYSFRCSPQVLGAAKETFDFARRILEVEINSVTDNPLVFGRDRAVISGGNFHGQPVAVALDVLGLGLSTIAAVAERRISVLLDPSLNNGLSPFLVAKGSRPGLSSGLMALQYTAAALVAENKILTHPASSDSIPTSANFEDFVSMGPGAAMKAVRILDNSQHVIAIELLAGLQAVDLRGGSGMSVTTKKIYNLLRGKIRPITSDRPFHKDIEQAYILVKTGTVADIVRKQVSE